MTTSLFSKSRPLEKPRFRARINWPLLIGLFLIGSVIYLAFVGPKIAPHDPLEEKLLIRDEHSGEWHIPPFPAFEVTGYPLGSDEFGRDLYSRLLWAIRPTLQMVAIVASVRLVLGTVFGLIAGWSTGRIGGFFDTLISGALALPGLLVALGTIAVVGVELGLIAFVIGLSMTGWAETARLVREQTRLIKGQVYIEASNALGASDMQIVFQHVLRQIQAMLLMLLAFEVSSTLMLTAGLGFLGYYIGGDVWVDVSDFVARRTSGSPELGQMLATAWVRLTDPWGLVSVGSVVFAAVLGFNLIGEGLRLRLNQEVQGGVLKWAGERLAGFFLAIEHYITYPVRNLLARPVPYYLLRLVLGMVVGATAIWGWEHGWFKIPEADVSFLYVQSPTLTPLPTQTIAQATPTPSSQVITVAGEATPPPQPEPAVIWEFETESIFTGDPVIAPDGTIYALTSDNLLHALAPDGTLLWQYTLPARGIDRPALAADGTIYVADREGALNAISPQGAAIWRYQMEPARSATSGPTIGPDGTIYYASGNETGMVQAVSSSGEGVWFAQGNTFSFHNRPQVSPDGAFVFLWGDIFNAADGTLLTFEYPSKIDRFLVGNDGKTYFRTGHNLVEWQWVNGAPEILKDLVWDYPVSEELLPQQAGVTRNQISWELYTSEGGGSTTVFWVAEVDEEGRQLAVSGAEVGLGRMIYMDDESLLTVLCGYGDYRFPNLSSPKPQCDVLNPLGEEETSTEGGDLLWQIQLKTTGNLVGAAYDPETERIYMTTQEGILYAVAKTPAPAGEATTFELPTTPVEITKPVVAWEYRAVESYWIGAPVSTMDGTVYAATNTTLTAFSQDGVILWETNMEPPPAAGPELASNGTIYLPDADGGVRAFDTQGNVLWHFAQPVPGLKASSKPVLISGGMVYYAVTDNRVGYIQAVSGTGEGLWLSDPATTIRFFNPPDVSAAGDLIFLSENIFDAKNGQLLSLSSPMDTPIQPEEFIAGENGKNYLRQGNTLFEWQRNGDQLEILSTIEWQFRAENAENPTFSISSPVKTEIGPEGKITLWYRYNVVWLSETGETLALANTTANHTIASAFFSDGTKTFTCGIVLGGPTDQSSEQCMGFKLGTEKPVWKIDFGASGQVLENVLGAARTPAGFVFISRKGMLYGVMEEAIFQAWEHKRQAENSPPEEATGAVSTGSGWKFDVPEPLLVAPLIHPDGSVYLLTDANTFYVLNPDGTPKATIALPEPVYVYQDAGFFGSGNIPMPPILVPDGSIAVASGTKVYALGLDGRIRWEFPLDAVPFAPAVSERQNESFFQLDRQGTLYSFSPRDGLLWKHDLAEGLRAASPFPVFGPNGEIYYTITNGTKGMIEALTPNGTPLWRVDLTTFSFLRPLEITPAGDWLIVDDNVVNTSTGNLVEADNLEFHVEEFAMGYDGKKYLMAGTSVIEWEVGEEGLRIVNSIPVTFPNNRSTGYPPRLSVAEDGTAWIQLFTAGASGWINMWVNPKGDVLGVITIRLDVERVLEVDAATNTLSVCTPNSRENVLACRGYKNGSGTPAWELNIEGIGRIVNLFYQDGRLYIQLDADTVQVVEVLLP